MKTLPAPSALPNGGFLSQPCEGRSMRLVSRRLRSSVALISAHGSIDASNADTLTEYTVGHLMRCRGLILDLSDLDFFGTAGFSALHRISVCCARVNVDWAVLSGEAVSRLLRISDPEGLLPAAGTLEATKAILQYRSDRSPRPNARSEDPGRSLRCERTTCLVCGGTDRSATNSGP